MTDLLLGVDLGTSSVKAAVIDLSGTTVTAAAEDYSVQQPRPGYAEQDPVAWWDALCRTVRRATSQCDATAIRAVGLSGQMHGTVLVDGDGELTSETAILWNDKRTQPEVDAFAAHVPAARSLELSGNVPSPAWPAFKLLWLMQHEASSIDRARAAPEPTLAAMEGAVTAPPERTRQVVDVELTPADGVR